jgi:hypothetical protein
MWLIRSSSGILGPLPCCSYCCYLQHTAGGHTIPSESQIFCYYRSHTNSHGVCRSACYSTWPIMLAVVAKNNYLVDQDDAIRRKR